MSSKNISRDGEKPKTYSFELALGVLIVLLFLTIFLSIKYYECYSDKKNCDNLSNLSVSSTFSADNIFPTFNSTF